MSIEQKKLLARLEAVTHNMLDIIARPLSIILERSWQSGEVLKDWKKANVTPSPKRAERGMQGTTGQSASFPSLEW